MVKKDKFNFLHNAPVKEVEEFDIENFSVKLISPIKKVKKHNIKEISKILFL